MGLREEYELDELLVNDAEKLVFEELEEQLASDDFSAYCNCKECVLDMATFALNSVKPAYHTSLLGALYAQNQKGSPFHQQVQAAVKAAIQKIGENPSHD